MKNLFFLLLVVTPVLASAQSNEILARSEFMLAEEAYGEADYSNAIKHLNQAIEYLGVSNPKIQALIVKSYFEEEQYEEAEKAMKVYFELADESDGDFMEMVRLVGRIREAAENVDGEEQGWKNAQEQNTPEAYEDFLKVFPEGVYYEKANFALIDLRWKEVMRSMDRKDFDAFVSRFSEYKNMMFLEMELVPGGVFEMGNDKVWQKPAHTTQVDSFYLGIYEVTYQDYQVFLANINDPNRQPESFTMSKPNNPVLGVYWIDAIHFCNFLSLIHDLESVYTIEGGNVTADWEANGYRLPTEAEWEYAAGGGEANRTIYSGTNEKKELPKYANYYKPTSSDERITKPVGSYLPNSLGMYDMSGNAEEWCWDLFDPDYYKEFKNRVAINPKGPSKDIGKGHSLKGFGLYYKVFARGHVFGKRKPYQVGFRVARAVKSGGK